LQLIDYAQPDETILAALRGALAGHGG
jgi:hypothetical protein